VRRRSPSPAPRPSSPALFLEPAAETRNLESDWPALLTPPNQSPCPFVHFPGVGGAGGWVEGGSRHRLRIEGKRARALGPSLLSHLASRAPREAGAIFRAPRATEGKYVARPGRVRVCGGGGERGKERGRLSLLFFCGNERLGGGRGCGALHSLACSARSPTLPNNTHHVLTTPSPAPPAHSCMLSAAWPAHRAIPVARRAVLCSWCGSSSKPSPRPDARRTATTMSATPASTGVCLRRTPCHFREAGMAHAIGGREGDGAGRGGCWSGAHETPLHRSFVI